MFARKLNKNTIGHRHVALIMLKVVFLDPGLGPYAFCSNLLMTALRGSESFIKTTHMKVMLEIALWMAYLL